MEDSLIRVFAEVLLVDELSLSDESSPNSVAHWDSLAAMRLVVAIEEGYDVELSTKEIMKMSSIGFARAVLKSKGVDI